MIELINASGHNGVFPKILKIAKVIPIFQKRIRVVCKQLLGRFPFFPILGRCTNNNALMSITENIPTGLDKGKCAGVFF